MQKDLKRKETRVTPDFIKVKNKIDKDDPDQLAFAFSMKSWDLILSESGHGKITRNKDERDFVGGWVWPNKGKITFSCGALGQVPDEFQYGVQGAIENHLREVLEPK